MGLHQNLWVNSHYFNRKSLRSIEKNAPSISNKKVPGRPFRFPTADIGPCAGATDADGGEAPGARGTLWKIPKTRLAFVGEFRAQSCHGAKRLPLLSLSEPELFHHQMKYDYYSCNFILNSMLCCIRYCLPPQILTKTL